MKSTLLTTISISILSLFSCENEPNGAKKVENQDSPKKTIQIDEEEKSDENQMIGTFKFNLSYESTEVYYFITFDYEFKQAKIKIMSTDYFQDKTYNEEFDEEREGVNMKSEKFEDVYLGKIKTLSETDKLIKCRIELPDDETFEMYYEKDKKNWYIDVKSTIYSDFTIKEKAYGVRQK